MSVYRLVCWCHLQPLDTHTHTHTHTHMQHIPHWGDVAAVAVVTHIGTEVAGGDGGDLGPGAAGVHSLASRTLALIWNTHSMVGRMGQCWVG